VDSAKSATDFDNYIIRILARIPKINLEEITEGVNSISLNKRTERMSVTISKNLLKEKKKEDGNNNKYNEKDNYSGDRYELYNDERENLDYMIYFLECDYYRYCDY
jgi:hypothetical protein